MLYVMIGVAFWWWTLRDESAPQDAMTMGGGILMALLWLPAVLVLVWLPAATRRRLDAAAQATVTAVRRQRGSPARGPLPRQDLLIAGLGIVLLLLLVLTLLSGCADYTCWAAHQFAGAHYGRQPGVCPPPPDTTVQAGGQP